MSLILLIPVFYFGLYALKEIDIVHMGCGWVVDNYCEIRYFYKGSRIELEAANVIRE